MPHTFHGIGTVMYGRRDFRPDSSYVTTVWFVMGYIPFVPIVSKRISYAKPDCAVAQFDKRGSYWICETTLPNWKQVLSVYGLMAAVISPIFLYIIFQEQLKAFFGGEDVPAVICLLIPVVAIFAPHYLRRWAVARMKREAERRRMGLGPEFRG